MGTSMANWSKKYVTEVTLSVCYISQSVLIRLVIHYVLKLRIGLPKQGSLVSQYRYCIVRAVSRDPAVCIVIGNSNCFSSGEGEAPTSNQKLFSA